MKNNILKYLVIGVMLVALGSCAMLKNRPPEYAIDPVCNMKVQKSEAYKFKYEEKKYYFDSYTCKQAFMMDPKNFLENKCSTTK